MFSSTWSLSYSALHDAQYIFNRRQFWAADQTLSVSVPLKKLKHVVVWSQGTFPVFFFLSIWCKVRLTALCGVSVQSWFLASFLHNRVSGRWQVILSPCGFIHHDRITGLRTNIFNCGLILPKWECVWRRWSPVKQMKSLDLILLDIIFLRRSSYLKTAHVLGYTSQ